MTRHAYTITEAAQSIGVSPKTLRAWMANPFFEVPRIQPAGRGGAVLIPAKELVEWLTWQNAKQRAAQTIQGNP